MKNKKVSLAIIGILLITISILIINIGLEAEVHKSFSSKLRKNYVPVTAKEDIENTTKQWREQLPMKISDDITLRDIQYENNVLFYVYEHILSKHDFEEVYNADEYIEEWRKNAVETAIQNRQYNSSFIKAKTTMIYLLKDKEGKEIFSFTITADEYK